MILFITKKVTNIYKAIISFFFLFYSPILWPVEELASFCFKPSTSLEEARDSLSFLLLPREKTFLRPSQRCMDVLTSPDRVKLLEKFLRLRYTLEESEADKNSEEKLQEQHCLLEMKKTSVRKTDTNELKVGVDNKLSSGSLNSSVTETSEILLGIGKPGVLAVGNQALYVECRKGSTGLYQLLFSLSESGGSSRISTEISTKKNEPVNVGQVTKDLNERNKIIGLPQSAVSTAVGEEETTYQLQIKN